MSTSPDPFGPGRPDEDRERTPNVAPTLRHVGIPSLRVASIRRWSARPPLSKGPELHLRFSREVGRCGVAATRVNNVHLPRRVPPVSLPFGGSRIVTGGLSATSGRRPVHLLSTHPPDLLFGAESGLGALRRISRKEDPRPAPSVVGSGTSAPSPAYPRVSQHRCRHEPAFLPSASRRREMLTPAGA
jgi:hypothetical protein